MKSQTIYGKNDIEWIFIGRDPERNRKIIDTNQYLIKIKDTAILTDPGGEEIFPQVMTNVSGLINVEKIKTIFCSHQDPDIISSLPLWLSICKNATVRMSWIWEGFIGHYGIDFMKNLDPIDDEGGMMDIEGHRFEIIPAHYLHSSANFNLFDHESRILFSGDIGGGVLKSVHPIFVENFDEALKFLHPFHKRMMASSKAKTRWIKKVRKLNPVMICPQHGGIFKGDMVNTFLDWLDELEIEL